MELHEFVRETLKQVIMGVIEAQESPVVLKSSAAIAPSGQGTSDKKSLNQEIEFDIAVTAKANKETKGAGGVSISIFKLETQGQSSKSNSHINKIKFKIPVYLPSQNMNKR